MSSGPILFALEFVIMLLVYLMGREDLRSVGMAWLPWIWPPPNATVMTGGFVAEFIAAWPEFVANWLGF